ELPDSDLPPTALGFSPDGRSLAAWSPEGVSVIDPAVGTARALWRTPPLQDSSRWSRERNSVVGFTTDSRCVIALRFTDRTGTNTGAAIGVFDATTGTALREHTVSQWSAVEVGPGRWVYASVYEKVKKTLGIIRWDPLTGELLPHFGEARR